MKNLFLSALCLFLLLSSSNSGYTQSKWYDLDDNEQYVTDFELSAGSTKTVTINSNTKIKVGFKSNATYEQFKKYTETYPVKLTQEDTNQCISSLYGGSMTFKPVNGKIEVTISNDSQDNFKIVIYTKNKD